MRNAPFEKLLIWQKSMRLAELVYMRTNDFPKIEEYGLKSQMRRCAVSVPSNIAESSQRGSDKDFANFILIAKGSLAELQTQVLLSGKFSYFSDKHQSELIEKIGEIDKMLFVFHKKLSNLPLTANR
jgi:four helix bundle protein